MGMYDLLVSANSPCAFVHPPLERPAALCTDPIKRAALWPFSHVVLFNPQGQVFADPNGRPLALNGAQLDAMDGQRAVFWGSTQIMRLGLLWRQQLRRVQPKRLS